MAEKNNSVDISSIDKNFVVPGVGEYDLIFTDARNSSIISLEGLKAAEIQTGLEHAAGIGAAQGQTLAHGNGKGIHREADGQNKQFGQRHTCYLFFFHISFLPDRTQKKT